MIKFNLLCSLSTTALFIILISKVVYCDDDEDDEDEHEDKYEPPKWDHKVWEKHKFLQHKNM